MTANYDRVDDAVSRGELWRAKEILRSRIGQSGYDPILYERYGHVLLRTADLVEAGKFLFLSGVRHEDYALAISLFVGRYTRRSPSGLWDAFPARVRQADIGTWPAVVVDELRALGATKKEHEQIHKVMVAGWSIGNVIGGTIVLLVIVAFLVGVLVGVRTILGWLFG